MRLINPTDGYQTWSERYDREMRDIFALQDDITLAASNGAYCRDF